MRLRLLASGAGIRRSARLVNGCAGEGTCLAIQWQGKDDLAEAVIVEVFGNDQRLREAHQHAFVAFGDHLHWQRAMSHRSAATVPVPQLTIFAAGTAEVLLFEPLIVVWSKRSRAKPVTRTTCPTLTRLDAAGEDKDAV